MPPVKRVHPHPAFAVLLTGLLLCGAAGPAPRADEGLSLSWGDCAPGTSAHDLSNACDINVGEQQFVCAFRLPFAAVCSAVPARSVTWGQIKGLYR